MSAVARSSSFHHCDDGKVIFRPLTKNVNVETKGKGMPLVKSSLFPLGQPGMVITDDALPYLVTWRRKVTIFGEERYCIDLGSRLKEKERESACESNLLSNFFLHLLSNLKLGFLDLDFLWRWPPRIFNGVKKRKF